jgi:hypothetical protein
MSKFFDDIQNNKWDSIKETMEQVVAKKIVNRIEAFKDQLKKNGSFQETRG